MEDEDDMTKFEDALQKFSYDNAGAEVDLERLKAAVADLWDLSLIHI